MVSRDHFQEVSLKLVEIAQPGARVVVGSQYVPEEIIPPLREAAGKRRASAEAPVVTLAVE